jgi:hypothetical protein
VANHAGPPGKQVIRGPYLQSGTMTNIIVCWRTDQPSDSRVQFGLAADALAWEVQDTGLTTEHRITLTNLAPDTKYYYNVGTSQKPLAVGPGHCFITAPAVPKPTRIWAIGDAGTASAGWYGSWEVRDAYYTFTGPRETDVWLMLGDNAYHYGTDSQYQVAVFNTYQDLLRRCVVWSTLGNHETYAPQAGEPMAYFPIFELPIDGRAGGVAWAPKTITHSTTETFISSASTRAIRTPAGRSDVDMAGRGSVGEHERLGDRVLA